MTFEAPQALRDKLKNSKRVCVFTGAGVSAESGIPTFRDAGGFWENCRLEDLVTPEAFARDPLTVWRWHAWLQGLSQDSQPNEAHKAIARMDEKYPHFLVITQNIDDLHERAGSKRLAKIHGDIMETRCLSKDHIARIKTPFDHKIMTAESLPLCPKCGEPCRPNVVWFGEMLPIIPLNQAWHFSSSCDLFIIVGTSGMVSGGYGFTEYAKLAGALVVEMNPNESALTPLADISIRLPATQAFAVIMQDLPIRR